MELYLLKNVESEVEVKIYAMLKEDPTLFMKKHLRLLMYNN